jgi:hypothetical protein
VIRLILLLLGARPLRQYWWAFGVASFLSLPLGLILTADLFDTAIVVTTDVIGILLVLESVVRLLAMAAVGFPNAAIPVLKALGFFALGFMAIDVPWDDNIVATIVLGAALILDGLFRWGRFRNADESAFYEYQCRKAGIPVEYCIDGFENDGSPVTTIVKGVKRALAGEGSRLLSVQVFAGQGRLIELGFRQGGLAGFGLRRHLLDGAGN